MDRGHGAVVRDQCHREPPWALPGPPRRDPQAARLLRRGGTSGAGGLRGTAPLSATRAGMAAERARTDPTAQGRHRGRGGGAVGGASRRVGSPTGSGAGASGPRRRGHRGGLHTRRARAPLGGALQGATTQHPPAARTAAGGAGRDRDRDRRPRPGPIGRRRAGAHRRPIREQSVGRQRGPRSRKGPARRRRCGGGGTVLIGSGATLERSRRPLCGGEHRAALERQAARTILEGIRSAPSVAPPVHVEDHDAVDEQPVASLNVFRREGDYWSVIFEGRTVRVRDLKGMRYLARLLADPGREYHVLDLVAAETGSGAQAAGSHAAGLPRSALGDAGESLDAQAKDAYRRRLAEIDDDLEQAHTIGDAERAAQANAERDFLVQELARAFGLGGRDRRAASASERARAAVTRAVRQAMTRIAEHHPQLGQHLSRTIRTGTYCVYVPDPRAPAHWRI